MYLKNNRRFRSFLTLTIAILIIMLHGGKILANNDRIIQPYAENPQYWQYKGKPVLLLGASDDDNLFQMDKLKEQLDLLESVGGNYIRCTMSSRDEGNLKPFVKKDGLFDLSQPNPEYWNSFEKLLSLALERDIIVQIEIWATYDFYSGSHSWAENPFNPRLNSSYNSRKSELPESIDYPAQQKKQSLFPNSARA